MVTSRSEPITGKRTLWFRKAARKAEYQVLFVVTFLAGCIANKISNRNELSTPVFGFIDQIVYNDALAHETRLEALLKTKLISLPSTSKHQKASSCKEGAPFVVPNSDILEPETLKWQKELFPTSAQVSDSTKLSYRHQLTRSCDLSSQYRDYFLAELTITDLEKLGCVTISDLKTRVKGIRYMHPTDVEPYFAVERTRSDLDESSASFGFQGSCLSTLVAEMHLRSEVMEIEPTTREQRSHKS